MQVFQARSQSGESPKKVRIDDLWETTPCNLCGSSNVKVKYEGTTDQDTTKLLQSYSASGNFISKETLVECETCGLVFTSPRLRSDLILKGYTESPDPNYVSQAEGRVKTFERCLNVVERYQKPGRILDVGAAAGFFLKVAKERGWETLGVEPSKYLADFGNKNYGVNIRCGSIETVGNFGKPMDVVTLWDVLEHTLDPKDVLARTNRLLKHGGHVVINYPNIGNWLARLAGRHYWFIISVHLYYFTPKTIAKMLEATGFEVVNQAPHYQFLELGYLIYRLESYLPWVAKFMGSVTDKLALKEALIPYFAAQTRVIARKSKEV